MNEHLRCGCTLDYLQFGMRDVTCNHECASKAEPGADGALRQLLPDLVHGLVQADLCVCVCV